MKKVTVSKPIATSLQRQIALALMIATVILGMMVPILSTRTSTGDIREVNRSYSVGQLANNDVFAPVSFQYVDENRTRQLIEEKTKAVLPRFSYSLLASTKSMNRLDEFFSLFQAGNTELTGSFLARHSLVDNRSVLSRIATLSAQELIFNGQVVKESATFLLNKGIFSERELTTISEQGFHSVLVSKPFDNFQEEQRSVDSLITKSTIEEHLMTLFAQYGSEYSYLHPALIVDVLDLVLEENVLYEQLKTLSLREAAADEVPPQIVTIERGDRLIFKDTVVTAQQLEMLRRIGNRPEGFSVLELIGRALFILFATLVSMYVFIQFLHQEKRLYLYLNLMLFSVILSLLALLLVSLLVRREGSVFLDTFLPVLFAPLFTAHITSKKRLGLVSAFLLSCYVSLMPQATSMTFFFTLTVSGICLYFFQYSYKRLEDLYNWFFACVISSFAALTLHTLIALPFDTALPLIGAMILNITITLVLVKAFVPLCERLFNIPTAYRLRELAFSDSPLLDRLSTVAQGTYNHSRNVADLAYQAARAVGANAMLARVGAIYHDIGKADHPEYFVENQGSENKHDDIKPSLSVAIIKSHVKLGLEKGREAGLPQEVLDIIAQHHGNDVIQFFYNEAKTQAMEAGADVKGDDYRYNGNPPAFAESAIVMLSDCVEAASRTLKRPNHSKYQKLVHSIIMGKIERQQLQNSQLSLTDLDRIEDAFIQTLIGRDHHRIEYPNEANQK